MDESRKVKPFKEDLIDGDYECISHANHVLSNRRRFMFEIQR